MNNEREWKELEEWKQMREIEEKEKWGMPYESLDIKSGTKKVDKIVKGIRVTGGVFIIFMTLIVALGIFMVITIFTIPFSTIKSRTNIDVIKTIENMYSVKVNIISKNVDENENGIYKLELNNNKRIQFIAIKNFGSLKEDFSDNCHKYYFEKWESDKKNSFIISEKRLEEMLEYDTYIKIDTYKELERAMDIINEFVEYCKDDFKANWKIYLMKGDYIIYPYQQDGMTKEDATKKAKEIFENIN